MEKLFIPLYQKRDNKAKLIIQFVQSKLEAYRLPNYKNELTLLV